MHSVLRFVQLMGFFILKKALYSERYSFNKLLKAMYSGDGHLHVRKILLNSAAYALHVCRPRSSRIVVFGLDGSGNTVPAEGN